MPYFKTNLFKKFRRNFKRPSYRYKVIALASLIVLVCGLLAGYQLQANQSRPSHLASNNNAPTVESNQKKAQETPAASSQPAPAPAPASTPSSSNKPPTTQTPSKPPVQPITFSLSDSNIELFPDEVYQQCATIQPGDSRKLNYTISQTPHYSVGLTFSGMPYQATGAVKLNCHANADAPPGQYSFTIEARDNDNPYNVTSKTLTITVVEEPEE